MVATYDRHGIRFLYPDNWTLQEDRPEPQAHCVTLQSPGSGFWMLQILQSVEPSERLAANALDSIRQDYEDVEVEPAREQIQGTTLSGYDLQFYCLDFVVTATVRAFSLGSRSCVLLVQAEDGEFNEIAPVFLAITTSLLREAGHAQTPPVEM